MIFELVFHLRFGDDFLAVNGLEFIDLHLLGHLAFMVEELRAYGKPVIGADPG